MVELTEFYGHDTVYLVRTGAGESLRIRASAAPAHRRGDAVTVRYHGAPAVSYAIDEAGAAPTDEP